MGWSLNQGRSRLRDKDVLKSISTSLKNFMVIEHDGLGLSKYVHQSAFEMDWNLAGRIEYVSQLEKVAKSLREKYRVTQFDDWTQYLLPEEHRRRSNVFVDRVRFMIEYFGAMVSSYALKFWNFLGFSNRRNFRHQVHRAKFIYLSHPPKPVK